MSEGTATFSAEISKLGDSIAGLSLKQAVELKEYLKATYGIEPAAGGAVMMAGPAGGGAAAAPAEEQTEFDVILKEVPADKKIGIIKVVREVTGLGLKEAKDLADNPGKPVKQKVSKDDANKLKASFEAAGAKIEIK